MQYHHFSVDERELIQYGIWDGKSVRQIARELNRSPASVSREINRSIPTCQRRYNPRTAHERALEKRKSRGRHDRLKNEVIRSYTVVHLKEGWSPEQIAGRIRLDLQQSISHEAIYQYIYAQVYRNGWGLLRPDAEDLRSCLRHKRKRRMRKGSRQSQRMSAKPGFPGIDTRPLVVNQRTRIGDWEGDTVESKDHKPGINTLVERKTGLVLITKLSAKNTSATVQAITDRFSQLPVQAKHTLTLDNGVENRDWQSIESSTHMKCYYAHPYHSWERGTNENTNGLIREYFPKKTDFGMIPDEDIALIEHKLNNRPRKRLQYLTPLEAFSVALAG